MIHYGKSLFLSIKNACWIAVFFCGFVSLPIHHHAHGQPIIKSVQSWTAIENIVTGMILESDNSLLVLENDSGELSRLHLGARKELLQVETLAAGLNDPIALTKRSGGALFIAERSPGRILLFRDNALSLWMDGFEDISSIRMDRDGYLWVTELERGRLTRIDVETKEKEETLKNLDYPSDILYLNNQLVLLEMVDRSNLFGRISSGNYEDAGNNGKPGKGNSSKPPDRTINETIVNPTRLSPDPRDGNYVLVSVRNESGAISTGAVVRLDIALNETPQTIASGLYGPTDIAVTSQGFYLLEEEAERISFIAWSGERTIIWDGLGLPRRFALDSQNTPSLIVSSQIPNTRLWRVSDNDRSSIPLPTDLSVETIAGLAIDRENIYLASFLSLGTIYALQNERADIFSQDVFAPSRIRSDRNGEIWALDPIDNEIVQLNSSGETISRYSGRSHTLDDFVIERIGEQIEIYALNHNQGKILQYNKHNQQFMPYLNIPNSKDANFRTFEQIPFQGFLVAQNNAEGSIVWIGESGKDETFVEGYPSIRDILWDGTNRIYFLSERGWIRSVEIENPSIEPTSTPTLAPPPTFTPTPSPTALDTPTAIPTQTPSSTPTPTTTPTPSFTPTSIPTSTPTPTLFPTATQTPSATPGETAIGDWLVYD